MFVKSGDNIETMKDSCYSTILLKDTSVPTVDCEKMQSIVLEPDASCDTTYKLLKPEGVFDDKCTENNLTYFYKYGDNDFVEFVAGTSQVTIPNGESIITWKVKDEFNESATCDQTITVNDIVNPTITCPNDTNINVINDCQIIVALNAATATDFCGIDSIQYSTDNNTFNLLRGETLDTTLTVGEHIIYWRSVDIHGLRSDVCSTTINILDTISPTVTCPASTS